MTDAQAPIMNKAPLPTFREAFSTERLEVAYFLLSSMKNLYISVRNKEEEKQGKEKGELKKVEEGEFEKQNQN